jgi:hypothetical protein
MFLAHTLEADPIAIDPDSTRSQELREFQAGDHPPAEADPTFRERLREPLWTMVSTRRMDRPPSD